MIDHVIELVEHTKMSIHLEKNKNSKDIEEFIWKRVKKYLV